MKKSTKNTKNYTWGENCKGWHFIQSPSLSIIEELMPPNTQEQRHYHSKVEQFFYILKGIATFTMEQETIKVSER